MRLSLIRSSLVLVLTAIAPACQLPTEVEPQVADPAIPAAPRYALKFKLIRGFPSPYPIGGLVGEPIIPSLAMVIVDQNGVELTNRSFVVTMTLGANPTGARLTGTTTVRADSGKAWFLDLVIDRPGVGYTLVANGTDLVRVESAPFDVLEPGGIDLIAPAEGAVIRQNDPTIGCPDHEYRGHGYQIRYEWSPSSLSTTAEYRVWVRRREVRYPAGHWVLNRTDVTANKCRTFVIDRNLDNWEWFVMALDGVGRPIEASHIGHFSFAPCRRSTGEPCVGRD